jgi:hypothetical protein
MVLACIVSDFENRCLGRHVFMAISRRLGFCREFTGRRVVSEIEMRILLVGSDV